MKDIGLPLVVGETVQGNPSVGLGRLVFKPFNGLVNVFLRRGPPGWVTELGDDRPSGRALSGDRRRLGRTLMLAHMGLASQCRAKRPAKERIRTASRSGAE
jgi:hypothetical protein